MSGVARTRAWFPLPFPSLGFAALCPLDCSCSQVLISPGLGQGDTCPKAVLLGDLRSVLFCFFPADKSCFCFTPSWGNASSQVLLSPSGLWPHLVFTALGLQKPRSPGFPEPWLP